MKRIEGLIILVIAVILFSGCARVDLPKLEPYHLLAGSYMNIHSPNSEDWYKVNHSNTEVTFAKYGKIAGESYIARVVFFPLEATKTKEEYLNLIKREASKSSNKERFITIDSDFKLSDKRDYLCVIAQQLSKDKMAKTSRFSKEELLMQVKSLYCKDPNREEVGFMVGYSFRGKMIDENFGLQADNFIKGVQFAKDK